MSGLALSAEIFTYWMLRLSAVSPIYNLLATNTQSAVQIVSTAINFSLFVVDVSQISYLEDAPRDLELSQTEK